MGKSRKLTPEELRRTAEQYARANPGKRPLTPQEIANLHAAADKHQAQQDAAEAFAKRSAAASQLRPLINRKAKQLLDQWKQGTDSILFLVPVPDDDANVDFWWLTLAGNLLWASTVFMPGGGAPVVFSSLYGAYAGTGTWQRGKADPPPTGDPRDLVRQSIAIMRGKLDTRMDSLDIKWAGEFFDAYRADSIRLANVDQFLESFVWIRLFDIPYDEQRFKKFGDIALKNVTAALEEFKRQFHNWRLHTCTKKLHMSYKYGTKECNILVPFKPDLGKALGKPGLIVDPAAQAAAA